MKTIEKQVVDNEHSVGLGVKIIIFVLLTICFFISPILSFLIATIFFSMKKESAIVSFFFGISISFPALFYVPLMTDDAYRIFDVVQSMQNVSAEYIITWLKLWAGDYLNYPLFTALMYFVSHHFNYTALSFIVAGITYSLITYTVWKYVRILKVNIVSKYLTLFASLSWVSYLETISGMRFNLACVMALYIILELFIFKEKYKIIDLAWLLIPLSIHPGVILIILPLFFLLILQRGNLVVKVVSFSIFLIGGIVFISGLADSLPYVGMLKRRLTSYQSTSFGYISSPQHIVHFCIAVLIAIISVVLMGHLQKERISQNFLYTMQYKMSSIYLVYFLITVLSLSFGMRLAMILPILFILIISSSTSSLLLTQQKTFANSILVFLIISGLAYNINVLDINFYNINLFFI